MASNHTPTPWKLDQYGSVFDARGKTVATNGFATILSPGDRMDEAKSNSALIVAAVNAYEANKDRLSELEAEVARLREALEVAEQAYQTGILFDEADLHGRAIVLRRAVLRSQS